MNWLKKIFSKNTDHSQIEYVPFSDGYRRTMVPVTIPKQKTKETHPFLANPPYRTKSTIAAKIGRNVGGALVATAIVAGASDAYLGTNFSKAVADAASNTSATVATIALTLKSSIQHFTQ